MTFGGEHFEQVTTVTADPTGRLTLFGWFMGRPAIPLAPGVEVTLDEPSGFPPPTNYDDTFVWRWPARVD